MNAFSEDARRRASGSPARREGEPVEPEAVERDRPPARDSGTELVEHILALRRYASVLVGNHADADDLVQETLKRALTYLEDQRQIGNLRAYLFTILHNARNDAMKKQARGGTPVPVEGQALVSEEATATDHIACNEAIRAMRLLNEEHRQVLLLVGVEGLSYRETSEILGLPIGTVMSRLNRARTALRDVLGLEGRVEIDRPS